MFTNLSSAIFIVGMLVLPTFLGSVGGIGPLVVSLIWLIISFFVRSVLHKLPLFQMVWLIITIIFFIQFALINFTWNSIQYGINLFAFVLALGVYWQFSALKNRRICPYVTAAMIGLLIGIIWSFYQHQHLGVGRITAYIGGGSNLVARIAILLAAYSMILLLINVNRWSKLLGYVFAIGATILIVIQSGSRGSLLALPLLLLLPIFFALPTSLLKSIPAWSAIFIFGLCVIGFIFLLDPNRLVMSTLDRLQSVAAGEGMDHSTELRYQMWQVAYQSFLEHPIIGTGWHSFVAVTKGTVLESYAESGNYFNFHSDIANFAVAGGIIGLLLYFLLLFAPLIFWDTPKDHPYFRVRLYWAVTMPILYLVLGLTDMVMGFDYPTMFYAFTFAIIWGLTEQEKGSDIKNGAHTLVDQTGRPS